MSDVPPPASSDSPAPARDNKPLLSLLAGGSGLFLAFCCSPFGLALGVAGAILGYLSRAAYKRTGVGKETEHLALGGLITGTIAIVLSILFMTLGGSTIEEIG